MWLPKWLGEAYSKLYVEFGEEAFRLEEAKRTLGIGDSKARLVAHQLHKRGVLLIFERGRPRLYRLLSPENFVLLASEKVERVSLSQERYVQLIYNAFRAVDRLVDVTSFVVYGSVARGEATPTSDVDLLLISDTLRGSLGVRVEFLLNGVREEVEGELAFLRRHGYYTRLSFYPLKREEAEKTPLLMLDMVEDSAIIYDREGFFRGLADRLRRRLAELGARRLEGKKGKYWDLKPGYRPLEVIPL